MALKLSMIDEGRYLLDARGYTCPYPQLMTMGALREIGPNCILEVIVDNPPSSRDIPIAIKDRKNLEVLDVQVIDDGVWKITIKKIDDK